MRGARARPAVACCARRAFRAPSPSCTPSDAGAKASKRRPRKRRPQKTRGLKRPVWCAPRFSRAKSLPAPADSRCNLPATGRPTVVLPPVASSSVASLSSASSSDAAAACRSLGLALAATFSLPPFGATLPSSRHILARVCFSSPAGGDPVLLESLVSVFLFYFRPTNPGVGELTQSAAIHAVSGIEKRK